MVKITMCIIAEVKVVFNPDTLTYEIEYPDPKNMCYLCPRCGAVTRYYDRKNRGIWKQGDARFQGKVVRVYCEHCNYHPVVLPAIVMKYKRYNGVLISQMVKDASYTDEQRLKIEKIMDEFETETEDGRPTYCPCERTIELWKKQIELNRNLINGAAKLACFKMNNWDESMDNES